MKKNGTIFEQRWRLRKKGEKQLEASKILITKRRENEMIHGKETSDEKQRNHLIKDDFALSWAVSN